MVCRELGFQPLSPPPPSSARSHLGSSCGKVETVGAEKRARGLLEIPATGPTPHKQTRTPAVGSVDGNAKTGRPFNHGTNVVKRLNACFPRCGGSTD